MQIGNIKIKWGKTAKKWCISYDDFTSKKKLRKQEFFFPEEEDKAKKRYLELLDIQVKNII